MKSHVVASAGDVHMADGFDEPLPRSKPEAKVDTSNPNRRSRSPKDRCRNAFIVRMTHDVRLTHS